MGVSDDHLELLLIDENKWIESLEEEHLLKLQEKLNNYIYFLESKQYVERYGDNFDKKVIQITFQYSPSDNGLAFLAAVQKVLQPTDMSLKVELPEWLLVNIFCEINGVNFLVKSSSICVFLG